MTAIPEPVLTKQEKKARKAPILLTAIETDHDPGNVVGGRGKALDSMGGNGQGAAHTIAATLTTAICLPRA